MSLKQWDAAPEMQIDTKQPCSVTMETSRGTIELELYPEHAPVTVNNFVFASGKPPGIVESTNKEDLVPYPEKKKK